MTTGKIELITQAQQVLAQNDRGEFTIPAKDFYPHQWLWDSCFIAIGLAHINPHRAATEILSLFRGQWSNGMLPHIIFSEPSHYWEGPSFWRSRLSPAAPREVATSGMTQPPMVAVAALVVADHLPPAEAKTFLKQVYPRLLAFHRWIYSDRDPNGSGLAVLVSPWESGLDNTPPWMEVLKSSFPPFRVMTRVMLRLRRWLRPSAHLVPYWARPTEMEYLELQYRAERFRNRRYDSRLHLRKSEFLVEDLTFNSILIAANRALFDIATILAEDLPPDLTYRMSQTEQALEGLWDKESGEYYCRNFKSKELIKTSSIATLLPLFSGTISQERANSLAKKIIIDKRRFWPAYPVPSAPLDSPYFDERRYWHGPTWINTNWLIIKGLETYGFTDIANQLRETCLQLVSRAGFREYFSPLSGQGQGIDNFSWTAALTLDLLKTPVQEKTSI